MSGPGHVLIIGAGPTGLGAAYRLHELNYPDFQVLEERSYPGGLASSYKDTAGFTWDVGGHVQHSHYQYYDDVIDRVLGDRRYYHEREAWIWLKGRFVPYPFQYNLHHLDPDDCTRALTELERAATVRTDVVPENFADWIDATFGAGIGELFMHPYNSKVWGYPLETLSADWIQDRVAVPDLRRVKRNVQAKLDDVSWGPNNLFFYPAEGGTGTIWSCVADQLPRDKVVWDAMVISVDVRERQVTLGDGTVIAYGSLISSMPLDLLCRMCSGLDDDTTRAAESLVYSSCHIIGVGLRGAKPDTLDRKCWIYYPEPAVPYYRVTVLSNYSPNNVPPGDGYWSLMAEVCETSLGPVDRELIVEYSIEALKETGLIPTSTTVVSRWHRREEYGYPTPFLGRKHILSCVQRGLEQHRIYSRGRFGAWQYEVSNQDHSFMQGVEVVNRLLGVGTEETVADPNLVNRR